MQGRKECYFSLFLESSMNMTCRVMGYEELIMYQKFLDEQDDIQDAKMKGLLLEKKSMDKHFSKRLLKIAKEGGDIEKLQKEIDVFNNDYEKRLNKILEIRNHLEGEDDKTRERLLIHTDNCHKNLREENNRIEKRLIKDNLDKKLSNLSF